MLPVLANTSMTMADMAPHLAGLLQSGRHIEKKSHTLARTLIETTKNEMSH